MIDIRSAPVYRIVCVSGGGVDGREQIAVENKKTQDFSSNLKLVKNKIHSGEWRLTAD